jgi:hypothetical protein
MPRSLRLVAPMTSEAASAATGPAAMPSQSGQPALSAITAA